LGTSAASENPQRHQAAKCAACIDHGAWATGRATPSVLTSHDRRDERAGPADGLGVALPVAQECHRVVHGRARAVFFLGHNSCRVPAIARSILGLRSDSVKARRFAPPAARLRP